MPLWREQADGGGRPYVWTHWDLADPELAGWLDRHVPPRAAQALCQSETRPRCFADGDGMVLILRGVNLNPGQREEDMVSLRAWADAGQLVTVRVRRVFSAEELRRALAEGHTVPPSPAGLLARLADALTQRLEQETLRLEDRVDTIEEAAFDDRVPPGSELAHLRRASIRLARFARPQAIALDEAARLPGLAGDLPAVAALSEAANRARRAEEFLDSARQRLAAVSDHLDIAQAARLGRNSYVLSVIAAIFLPLGFLTGLFGVNVAGMPGIDTPSAFWWLVVATVVIGGLVAGLLRWLRLL